MVLNWRCGDRRAFSDCLKRMSVAEQMEANTSPARSGEDHLKLIFDLCDQDKDGFITAQDFRSLGNEHFGNTQVRERERERERELT